MKRRSLLILVSLALSACQGAESQNAERLRELAYAAAMKSDLRNLATAEEAYFADNLLYTTDLSALRYAASAGVTGPTIVLISDGWVAQVGHSAVSITCAIYIGSTRIAPATTEGVPSSVPEWEG